MNVVHGAQSFVHAVVDIGVQMHWVNERVVGKTLGQRPNGVTNIAKSGAKVLATVTGDQYDELVADILVFGLPRVIEGLLSIACFHERVDYGVSGNSDLFRTHSFRQQGIGGTLSWSAM